MKLKQCFVYRNLSFIGRRCLSLSLLLNIFEKEKGKPISRCRCCRTPQSLSWLAGAKIDGLRRHCERRRGRRLRRIDQKIVSMR